MLRPFDYNQSDYATEPDWAGPGTVRDSLGMMVCAANASDPASLSTKAIQVAYLSSISPITACVSGRAECV